MQCIGAHWRMFFILSFVEDSSAEGLVQLNVSVKFEIMHRQVDAAG